MVGFAKSSVEPTVGVKFVSAGLAACTADLFTFPLDTAKVRLQIQGEQGPKRLPPGSQTFHTSGAYSMYEIPSYMRRPKYVGVIGTVRKIAVEEGIRGLYGGFVAGLQRQMAFASIRIGFYDSVKGMYTNLFNVQKDKQYLHIRILAGMTTGGLAVQFAQPTDVVKVRMQAQGNGKAPKRYKSAVHAYKTIFKQEGIRGLWKGTFPNMSRNAVVNCCELVSYDIIKDKILHYNLMRDNMPCHFVSGFGAGFITTIIASPVDVVKTRFMNSKKGAYKGALNCAYRMMRDEGPLSFYKGFWPSFMRLSSWSIVMFVCFEQLKRGFMSIGHNPEKYPTIIQKS